MKQHFLAFLLYLGLISSITVVAEEAATEQKVEPAPTRQRFCGVRQPQDVPAKKEADSIESLFEMDIFQSHFNKNCLLIFGLKGWADTWSLPIPLPNLGVAYIQDTAVVFKSATEFTAMPTLTFRYKNFYLSANRFFKTDYTFGTQKIDSLYAEFRGKDSVVAGFTDETGETQYFGTDAGGNSPLAIKIPIDITPVADRSEWDLTLGYYLNEYLALTVGYKKIQRNYKYHLHFPSLNLYQSAVDTEGNLTTVNPNYSWGPFIGDVASDSTGSGITIGILGAVPVRGKLSLYGSLTYGWLDTEIGSNPTGALPLFVTNTIVPERFKEYDTPYYSGEVGFSCYLGYRFQRYEFEDVTTSGQTARDGTDGFIASFSAAF